MGDYSPSPVPLAATVQRPEDGEPPTGAILGGPHEVAFDGIAACATMEHIGGVEGLGREIDGALVFVGTPYAGVRKRIVELANASQTIDAAADEYRIGDIDGGDKTLTLTPATSLLLGRVLRFTRKNDTSGEPDGLIIRGDDGDGGFYTLATLEGTGVLPPYQGTWVELAAVGQGGGVYRWVVVGWGGTSGITFDATNSYAEGGT